jgi:DNA-binding NtrC family response regulator
MNRLKVLLIDDEEELVTTLVERLGYRDVDADYALDGYSALLKMRENRYDVVLLDLKLPGIGGREVLKRLHKDYPEVPVLLITGHGMMDQVDQNLEGAYDYLVKPAQVDDLVAKMREAVERDDRGR